MKKAGDLAKKYLQWALEQRAKQDKTNEAPKEEKR